MNNAFEQLITAGHNRLPRSNEILERARKVCISMLITGPYRAPANVAFIERAEGARVWDIDGHEYLDVTMAYGPLILGHAHPVAVEAAHKAVDAGAVYSIAHTHEVEMAELMVDAIPCADKVCFVNSGTEATMNALKIARATTGKDRIATFEGCYHGVHDYALVGSSLGHGAGPAEAPEPVADCKGIPQAVLDNVVKLAFDSPQSLDRIRELKDELAAVIIEPVPSSYPVNMADFLQELREVTRETGVLLILDEVISGFRCAYGGGQEKYGVTPDMATYGKIIGGGFAAGAITGSDAAMSSIISTGDISRDAKEQKVFTIGTFNANPVTMQVGAAVLRHLRDHPEIYVHIDTLTARVKEEVNTFAADNDMPLRCIGENSWFIPYMGDKPFGHTRDMHDKNHGTRNVIFSNYMRSHGIIIPDMHIIFFSAAHTDADADLFIDAAKQSLGEMRAAELI